MEIISKIYVGLIEFILLLLVAVPLVAVIFLVVTGGASSNFMVSQWFGSTIGLVLSLLVYYLVLVFVFGLISISISISNYRNLKRIADLLEGQCIAQKISEPRLARTTNINALRDEPSVRK
jgi:uncharacterized membrane protein